MGQKVNPISLRIGINRLWDSKWYASKKKFGKTLHQDIAIEKTIRTKLKDASVSKVEILRTANAVTININTAKPGLIIGRGGETIEELKDFLEKSFDNRFSVNIIEIKQPNLDARLVAESIVNQVEKRISYRRAAKMAIDKSLEVGALGVKVRAAGRLNGVEIARTEFFSKGKIPLHTFRADIDYAYLPANTSFGVIGVKVWIYKGDVFKKDMLARTADVQVAEERKIEAPGRPNPRRPHAPAHAKREEAPRGRKPAPKKTNNKK